MKTEQEEFWQSAFGDELMNKYSSLELVDYDFHYHKDPIFPQDDGTWFLMKKIK
jgi:spore coat polysaccharide biosynthesis protein SpsF